MIQVLAALRKGALPPSRRLPASASLCDANDYHTLVGKARKLTLQMVRQQSLIRKGIHSTILNLVVTPLM